MSTFVIPNRMKRIVTLIAVVPIAFVLLLSCKRENQDPEPTQDVEIKFDIGDFGEKLDKKYVQEYVQDKTIRYVYLVPTDHWTGWTAGIISALRKAGLQPCVELNPQKVRGRGDFDIKLGEASKVPEDSLWYVQNGWTINKRYQK